MEAKKDLKLKKPKFPKLFLKYFISHFTLTLLICLAVGTIVFWYISRTYETQITEENLLRIQQVTDDIDNELLGCSQTALKISKDSKLLPNHLAHNAFNRVEAVDSLKKYRYPSGIIREISIVPLYEEQELVFSTMGTFSVEKLPLFCGIDQLQLYQEMEKHDSPFLMLPAGSAQNRDLLYIFPKPYAPQASPYGAIVFTLQGSILLDKIKDGFADNADFAFFFSGEYLLLSNKPGAEEDPGLQSVFADASPSGIFSLEDAGHPVTVIKGSSQIYSVGCAVQMDKDRFLESVHQLRLKLMGLIGLLLLMSAAGSLMQALRTYKPVKHLFENVMKRTVPEENVNKAFQPVYQAMQDEYQEKEKLKTRLTTQSGMLSSFYVTNLLQGSRLLQTDSGGNLEFSGSCFQAVCICMDDFASYSLDDLMVIQNRKLMRTLLERFCFPWCRVYFSSAYEQGCFAILLNFDESTTQELICGAMAQVQTAFAEKAGCSVTVALGSVVEEKSQIHTSFLQGKYAASYRVLLGWNRLICYTDLPEQRAAGQGELISEENVRNIYMSGEAYQITKALETVFIRIQPGTAPETICGEYRKFVRVMEQIVTQRFPQEEKLIARLRHRSQAIPETAAMMYESLVQISTRVTGLIYKTKGDKNEVIARKVMAYIGSHYQDNTLSLGVIADEIGVTSSYLSRCFKDYADMTILQYLDQVRMNLATELLLGSNLTVKAIVAECGYVDVNNFTRKFKKFYGVTPAAYREKQENDKKENAQ